MPRNREIMIGWAIYGLTIAVQFVLLHYFMEILGPDSPFRALALACAFALVPGYAIVLSLHLWLHKLRPGFLHVLGGISIWVGMLLFGLPLSGPRDISDVLAIVLFFGGQPLVAPFSMRLYREDMERRGE